MQLLPRHITLTLLTGICFSLVLITSSCRNQWIITSPQDFEICTNQVDDDKDGQIDCRDSECAVVCKPTLTISALDTIKLDTAVLIGTSQRASRIKVSLSPTTMGIGGDAFILGSNWSITLRALKTTGLVTVTAIAIDSTGLYNDTAIANFQVRKN